MKVESLIYYPIKSCRGIEVQSSLVEARGLANDRRLMVIYATGRFLTQRDKPALALVQPTITGTMLTLNAPQMSELTVDLSEHGKQRTIDVWNDTCTAIDGGEEAARWLTSYLKVTCRLVKIGQSFERKAKISKAAKTDVSFADHYPLVVTTKESLAYLNQRVDEPLMMSQMRPNMVISGGNPFEEYDWSKMSIGNVQFAVVEDCERCSLTLINQDTASRGQEPLRILTNLKVKETHRAVFGIHVAATSFGQVSVGDNVTVSGDQRD